MTSAVAVSLLVPPLYPCDDVVFHEPSSLTASLVRLERDRATSGPLHGMWSFQLTDRTTSPDKPLLGDLIRTPA